MPRLSRPYGYVLPLTLLLLAGCSSGLRIHDKPIAFSERRVGLTQDYIATHYGRTPDHIYIVPHVIVLHWTAIDDFKGSFRAFNPETLGGNRPDIAAASQVNVSIHFLVDRDGTVYRLMPEIWMARHVIGLNHNAIGIENVGGAGGEDDLTDDQLAANVALVRYLTDKYPTIEYLIGHHEYRLFEGHSLWRERDPHYRTEKHDPGARFMQTVRTATADRKLKGPAAIRRERRR